MAVILGNPAMIEAYNVSPGERSALDERLA
jgi:hypothetical protein